MCGLASLEARMQVDFTNIVHTAVGAVSGQPAESTVFSSVFVLYMFHATSPQVAVMGTGWDHLESITVLLNI